MVAVVEICLGNVIFNRDHFCQEGFGIFVFGYSFVHLIRSVNVTLQLRVYAIFFR